MPRTKRPTRQVLTGKCCVCQGNFETSRQDAKTCSNLCRQKLHRQELLRRLTSYAITTDEELKAGIVEVLPRMATRYGTDGQAWIDFDWTTIPQRQKDLMEVYALAEGISVDTLQRDFEQTLMAKLGVEVDQKAAARQEERDAVVEKITE